MRRRSVEREEVRKHHSQVQHRCIIRPWPWLSATCRASEPPGHQSCGTATGSGLRTSSAPPMKKAASPTHKGTRKVEDRTGCRRGCRPPACGFKSARREDQRRRGRTAWYEGVSVVILCLLRAYSKKNILTLSAIFREIVSVLLHLSG